MNSTAVSPEPTIIEPLRALFLRFVDSSALLVWGTVLCYFSFSGRVESYLHPWFYTPTLITGILLVLLGIIVFLLGGTINCECVDPDCPTPASSGYFTGSLIWLVLVVPLLAACFASPSQFGATAIMNRGLVQSIDQLPMLGSSSGLQEPFHEPGLPTPNGAPGEPWVVDPSMDVSTYLLKNDDGYILAETIDLLFAANEDPIRADFEDKPIEIVGQFLPSQGRSGASPDEFQLIRIFIMCCAADGRPIGITVRGTPPGDFEKMSWIKLRGTARFPVVGGRRIPVIEAESIEPTEAPRQTFLY